ncbi:MAG TPA: RimK/LysX family protein [Gemmataceae bacterium]|nr:RimK/LysX family protein [Gemmataceae bacterium]
MKELPSTSETSAAASRTAAPRPLTIGWKEYVDFPAWNIRRVKAKIDTGARTSALDALHYDLRETDSGLVADLRLVLSRKHPHRVTVVSVPVLEIVVVRSSTGIHEQRPLIETVIRLGAVTKRIPMTVTNRSRMLFRMILGRKALEGDFVVDVSKKYLLRT